MPHLDMPDAAGLMVIVDALEQWLRRNEFSGADPFDALAGHRLPAALTSQPRLRQAAIQAAKRSPVDLRPALGVAPRRLAKALGLIASGYAALEDAGWEGPARERAQALLAWLEQARVPADAPRAWGYEFDVQTRWAFYTAGTPNIIVTTFVANSFLDWYERGGEEAHLTVARAATDLLVDQLLVAQNGRRYFGYVPGVATLIHNANVLGSGLLARTGSLSGRDDWMSLASEAAEVTVGAQGARGLWPYGEGPSLQWVDGFHTAYVLDSLYTVWQFTGDDEVLQSVRRGLGAYIDLLFDADGAPRYTPTSLYPIDIHCASSAIDLFVRLRHVDERCWSMARGVLAWTVANMWDPSGYFYFQKARWHTNKIPYIRWSQAHMFRAMARMLVAAAS